MSSPALPASPSPDTFQQLWRGAADEHADRTFLVFRAESGAVTAWTYAEFDRVVDTVAAILAQAGVGPGSAVHIALRNCPAFVALWLAVARLGAWFVPVDPSSAPRDITGQLRRAQPVLGVCASARSSLYREGAGHDGPIVLALAEDASDLAPGGALRTQDAPESGTEAAPGDRLAVMFTSGTTAEPKGVVLTQANYACAARMMSQIIDLQPRHRWHVTLPLFHANAQYYCIAPAIAVGASVALSASFTASGWVRHARELQATHASLFAAPLRMILARCPAGESVELEHVWFAQNLGQEHYEQFARLVGTRPRQLYGMTETVAIVCADASRPPTHDVIGTPLPGRRIHVADPGGDSAPEPGQPGELHVLGTPGVDLFAGYLDDERTTARVFRETGDGTWFATGDLVSTAADGQLRFAGRADDVIKVSGENVSLTEIEAVIAQAPGVLEAAVIAQPDPIRDVVPVAYVVARDPADPPRESDLALWAEQNLTPAARPRAWHLIDELPRTSVGKVRRFRIAP